MTDEAALRQWICQHKVAWEIRLHQDLREGHVRTSVGLDLTLYASASSDGHVDPGGPECVAVYERLREIASSVLPTEPRACRYEIAPYDASVHLRAATGWAAEVELTVQILHREGYFRPIGECETKSAAEIRAALERLGVRREA